MKQIIVYIASAWFVLLVSCEKVIDVNVRDADRKYVIEGVVTDEEEGQYVKITTTKKLSDNNDFPGVRNAVVRISDDNGNTVLFEEGDPGVYKPAYPFAGASGTKYTLTVDIDDEQFAAVSTMPRKVKMDTIYITEEFLFGQVRKAANIAYKDPPGERNYYRFIQFIEGVRYNRVFISNDEYTNGNAVTDKLRTPADDDDHQMASGNTVTVHALCIDQANNDYWTSFLTSGATGGSGTASPANPTTNIQGGALGYFSAHTVQVLEVVVP